jgi:short-subunit dehydrogenase
MRRVYPNLIKSNFLERAILRGKNSDDVRSRREQLEQILQVPIVEKPEDVANAIWDAVANKRSEVTVGSANFSALINNLLPGLNQWLMRRTFQHKDKTSSGSQNQFS